MKPETAITTAAVSATARCVTKRRSLANSQSNRPTRFVRCSASKPTSALARTSTRAGATGRGLPRMSAKSHAAERNSGSGAAREVAKIQCGETHLGIGRPGRVHAGRRRLRQPSLQPRREIEVRHGLGRVIAGCSEAAPQLLIVQRGTLGVHRALLLQNTSETIQVSPDHEVSSLKCARSRNKAL